MGEMGAAERTCALRQEIAEHLEDVGDFVVVATSAGDPEHLGEGLQHELHDGGAAGVERAVGTEASDKDACGRHAVAQLVPALRPYEGSAAGGHLEVGGEGGGGHAAQLLEEGDVAGQQGLRHAQVGVSHAAAGNPAALLGAGRVGPHAGLQQQQLLLQQLQKAQLPLAAAVADHAPGPLQHGSRQRAMLVLHHDGEAGGPALPVAHAQQQGLLGGSPVQQQQSDDGHLQ